MSIQQIQTTERTYQTARSSKQRRNVLGAIILPITAVLCVGAAVWGENRGHVPANTKTATYSVEPGDTLWSISSKFDTRDNIEAVEAWITQRNHLSGDLQPGQVVTVPVGK